MSDDSLRFPIGRHQKKSDYSRAERREFIDRLAAQPAKLRAAVEGLTDEQLVSPYRPGGWTIRQVVHHVADSHLNAFIRIKLGITETKPTVKPYDQDAWVQLPDATGMAPDASVAIVEGVHARMVTVLRAMSDEDFRRVLFHPENGDMTIDDVVSLYAWHGDHHIAHVTSARERNGW